MTARQKQCLLAYLGYYKSNIDGIWGDLSKLATESFQRAYQLTVDGVFGDETAQRIREVIASGEAPTIPEESATGPVDEAEDDFWKGIKYWSREEFKCRCGEYHAPYCNGFPVEPDHTLVELADDVRGHFGRPGHRSSGIRCTQHNADSNGVSNSRHLRGKALDFRIEGHTAAQVLAYVLTLPNVRYAYDIDGTYVHMDVE